MARLKQHPSPLLATVLFSVLALGASAAKPTAEEKMNLLASGFQAFLGGDVATFVSMFAEDHVYIVEGGPELPWSGVTKGQDGVVRAVGIYSQYVNFTVNDMDLFASPSSGRIIAQYNLKGNSLVTGEPIEMPCFLRFTVNDDLRVEETIEACNALKEYRILIQTEAHPVGGTCDPKSNKPNQCFNSDGSYYVCCPGQCAGSPGLRPACA